MTDAYVLLVAIGSLVLWLLLMWHTSDRTLADKLGHVFVTLLTAAIILTAYVILV